MQAKQSRALDYQQVAEMLGGQHVLKRRLMTPFDVHEMLVDGLPSASLSFVVGRLGTLGKSRSLEKLLGKSLRTVRRSSVDRSKPLTTEESGRIWEFVEVLAKASEVFGSQSDAEDWLERPAIGLSQWRPIDLLTTPLGQRIVKDFLGQLEYRVYV